LQIFMWNILIIVVHLNEKLTIKYNSNNFHNAVNRKCEIAG